MDSMDVFPVVTVGGIQYTIWNEFKKSVEPSHFQAYGPDTWNSAAYIPATVFTIPTHGLGKGDLNPEEFRAAAQSFSDDVWNEEFLQGKWHN